MSRLVLLRDCQSHWDVENRFAGWHDIDITTRGAKDAAKCGEALLSANILPDVVHTSLQTRAIKTANLALRAMDRLWIPVRRHWRLNQRHYGVLTGLNQAEIAAKYGDEHAHLWCHGYDTPPPDMPPDNPDNPNADPRYANLGSVVLPTTECLKDVVERVLPYWFDAIIPDMAVFGTVMVTAHGDSLRALVKHLSHIGDSEIPNLTIPAAMPLIYEIGSDGRPTTDISVENRYLR